MIKGGDLKIFLTSFPNGELIPVEVIEKHESKIGCYYIRYPDGGTDTTNTDFLYDLPMRRSNV